MGQNLGPGGAGPAARCLRQHPGPFAASVGDTHNAVCTQGIPQQQ